MNIKKFLEKNIQIIILPILFLYLFFIGLKAISPLPITYDSAMHAEIVDPIISSQIYPLTWNPLTDTQYTYPPLFHWISFLITRFGLEAINVVNLFGVFLYAIIPILVYKIGLLYNKKHALLSSIISVGIVSWSYVFAVAEYPQLLAMDLSLIFLYFFLKKDSIKAGIFLGLTALAHPFVPVYLLIFIFFYLIFDFFRERDRKIFYNFLKMFLVFLIINSIWSYQYFEIINNAISGKWGNVRWYYNFGFKSIEEIKSYFFNFDFSTRIYPILFFLSVIGSLIMIAKKQFLIPLLFFYTIIFSIFHIPGTQYKFQDMLALTPMLIIPFAMISIYTYLGKINKFLGIFFLLIVIIITLPLPFLYLNHMKECCTQIEVPNENVTVAAKWLRSYDYQYSRILTTEKYEAWFSVLSHKFALDPMVTDLEAYSNVTKEQINDRALIIDKIRSGEDLTFLINKYRIKYIVSEENETNLIYQKIYDTDGIEIYKTF